MTDEGYLLACGWEPNGDAWSHERHQTEKHWLRRFTLAEAVEFQLAEDRARYNFVRERSEMLCGMLVGPPK